MHIWKCWLQILAQMASTTTAETMRLEMNFESSQCGSQEEDGNFSSLSCSECRWSCNMSRALRQVWTILDRCWWRPLPFTGPNTHPLTANKFQVRYCTCLLVLKADWPWMADDLSKLEECEDLQHPKSQHKVSVSHERVAHIQKHVSRSGIWNWTWIWQAWALSHSYVRGLSCFGHTVAKWHTATHYHALAWWRMAQHIRVNHE